MDNLKLLLNVKFHFKKNLFLCRYIR